MEASVLADVMGRSIPAHKYVEYAPFFNAAMIAAGCTTAKRAAAWCAQIGHESSGLQWMEELGDAGYFTRLYEHHPGLGNTRPGDGARFHGRGPIQLTGRHNYMAFGLWCKSQGFVTDPDTFVNDPGLVATPRWGFLAASWYWTVSRPQLNALCDGIDLANPDPGFKAVTRAINGGENHYADRKQRFIKALQFGDRLLPKEVQPVEKVLEYSRNQITQDTFYNCGPASCQTIIQAAIGKFYSEADLGRRLGTSVNGTDYIGQFPRVLNEFLPDAKYKHVDMPNDPPTQEQKQKLWDDIVASIDAGYGVVCNIVAPRSNYPRGIYGSVSPAYGGGTVYHYIAAMGYRDGDQGRAVWIADSGFSPYGYWVGFDQLSTLIPPKGYAHATAQPKGDSLMTVLTGVSAGALHEAKVAAVKTLEYLTRPIKSRINPKKDIDLMQMVSFIDEKGWMNHVLLVAVCRKLGLNPEQLVIDAIKADQGK